MSSSIERIVAILQSHGMAVRFAGGGFEVLEEYTQDGILHEAWIALPLTEALALAWLGY